MPTASMHSSGLFNLITRISSESLATDPSAEKWRSVAVAELIRRQHPAVIDGAAHMPNLEQPAKVNLMLHRFLALRHRAVKISGRPVGGPLDVVRRLRVGNSGGAARYRDPFTMIAIAPYATTLRATAPNAQRDG